MSQDKERRLVKMLGLTYPPARPLYQCKRQVSQRVLRGASGGFTVIEILIVVVILAIAAMTAIPMMSSAGGVQIRSAANMIAADMEYAKSRAISRGQNFSVVFDVSTESYRIEDQYGSTISHPVKKGFDYVIDFGNEGLDRVDITDVDFNGTSRIQFDYLGSPDNGGTVSMQAGGITAMISVEPVTGYISIAD